VTPGEQPPESTGPEDIGRQESAKQDFSPDSQRATLQDIQQLNAAVVEELVALLVERKPILLAGAGCSVDLGYPDWWTLVHEIRDELAPGIAIDESMDLKDAAELVKRECARDADGECAFSRYLGQRFSPRRPNSGPLQERVVRLGFAGLVTTNYDVVLETAVQARYSGYSCQPVNLCDPERNYLVLDFFRELGQEPCPYVLHLHGCFDRPANIVLARSDYMHFYNKMPIGTSIKEQIRWTPRDSLHRRTIWALLATRRVVFVGFSLKDDFFVDVMNVWRTDFSLRRERPHFALIGVHSDADLVTTLEKLHSMQVKPIFYEIPCERPYDHSGLQTVMADLAARMGVSMGEPDVNEISQRTLEML
jgi:hypothetical protein